MVESNGTTRGSDFGARQYARDLDALARIAQGEDLRRLTWRLAQLHFRSRRRPLCREEVQSFRVRVGGREIGLCLRENQSDWYTFAEVFLRQGYAAGLAAAGSVVRSWVDVGAHIGLASLWLSALHPQARVVCVEPVVETLRVLRQNLQPLPNASVVEGAVAAHSGMSTLHPTRWWSSCTIEPRVAAARLGTAGRAEQLVALEPRSVRAWTLDQILAEHGLEQVDVLKLDLEGAEELVIQPRSAWLRRVRTILLDLHAKYVNGARVVAALEEAGFRRVPQASERLDTLVWTLAPQEQA